MRLAVFTSGARIRLAASAQIYLGRVLAPFRNLEASAINLTAYQSAHVPVLDLHR
jgi:hypothetical protein